MEQGTNRRFVVTTKGDAPEELYGFYAKRGAARNSRLEKALVDSRGRPDEKASSG